jgi:alpha-L-arabinofuranosidase
MTWSPDVAIDSDQPINSGDGVTIVASAVGPDVAATKSADGRRVVAKTVNPAENRLDMRFALDGSVPASSKVAFRLESPESLDVGNSFEIREAVRAVDAQVERAGNNVRIAMPRWSVGVVEVAN